MDNGIFNVLTHIWVRNVAYTRRGGCGGGGGRVWHKQACSRVGTRRGRKTVSLPCPARGFVFVLLTLAMTVYGYASIEQAVQIIVLQLALPAHFKVLLRCPTWPDEMLLRCPTWPGEML